MKVKEEEEEGEEEEEVVIKRYIFLLVYLPNIVFLKHWLTLIYMNIIFQKLKKNFDKAPTDSIES